MFFQERRKTGLFVSYDLLREEAIKKVRSLNIPQSCFKASKGWAIRCMRRMGLALRHRTTICQKCCIIIALDGSEDVIVWEYDVEDKMIVTGWRARITFQLWVKMVNLMNNKL
jgi:hypothetical protein